MSYSNSATQTFSATNAKHLASRVASDLYQCSRMYGMPSETSIPDLQADLAVMLTGGYVATYEFGFKRDGKRVLTWYYAVDSSGNLVGGNDDRSGGIYAHADVSDAEYFNFMTYSQKWTDLNSDGRTRVKSQHNINRGTGEAPSDGTIGNWYTERTYTSGGVRIDRKSFH